MNATGLPDPEHYTTARDVAILSLATIRDFPDFYAWYAEKEFTFNGIRQHNRNTLLWRDPAIDGLKTGHTESAGFCLAASAMRDGMRLISAVMGSASEASRASETQTLLNYGFRFFETVQLYQAGQELAKTRVWKGTVEEVPRGRYADLDAQVQLQPRLTAPLAAGTVVGQVEVRLGEELIASRDLQALSAVDEAGFFGSAWDGLLLWVDGMFADDEAEAEAEPEAKAETEAEAEAETEAETESETESETEIPGETEPRPADEQRTESE
jgi:D-alanyl-D-alanine carboxypeptidase (penicillin-binding protein 5/6)